VVTASAQFRQILGIRFFVGDADEAVARMSSGGLLVVPAAPALKNLANDPAYREALQGADLVITDSAFMVMIWNRLKRDSIRRVSGLKYLSFLLKRPDFYQPGGSFWIMASEASARKNSAWLRRRGIELAPSDCYVAPLYGKTLSDPALLRMINERHPRHIVVTLGGGTQERLGLYLRSELDCKPSIHCVGAAIAFLSGDQVLIPDWADRMYLGWLFRCLSDPRRYMPRYWDARKLLSLMIRYGSSLPDTLLSAPASTVELATALASKNIPSTPTTSQ
jgi:N-acetylglucosaminyldiphosphoundecaprenol N-acetyl-beta-D-mannosaminyltransferase